MSATNAQSPPSSPVATARPTRARRRRVGLACVSCRNRKSRCNGQRPRCSTCTELDLVCEYVSNGEPMKTVVIGKHHLQSIEDRLGNLERCLRSQQQQSTSRIPQSPSSQATSALAPVARPRDQDDGAAQTSPTVNNPSSASPLEGTVASTVEAGDPTDGMGHMLFTDEEHRAYFGPSSSITFTSDLSKALWSLLHPRSGVSSNNGGSSFPKFHIARVSRQCTPALDTAADSRTENDPRSSVYYLPPDDQVVPLIDRYFSDTGMLFPYLHEETFRNAYRLMRQNVPISRTWLGVLNMVLAMAVHTSTDTVADAKQRNIKSDQFYIRACRLCDDQVINAASVEMVQYLLLVSQYRQGTKSSVQTWATHGLAVKLAFQLGLHSTEASKRFSPLEREIRKRTWIGCVVLDRSLSMTFGRPASIPGAYSRLEQPSYYDSIEPWPRQPWQLQRCRHSTDFFCATNLLYVIMGDTIDLIYGSNLGCGDDPPDHELMIRILKLRQSLEEWTRQLPPHMPLFKAAEYQQPLDADPNLNRLRSILTLRYHNLRILVNRVVLVRLFKAFDDNATDRSQDLDVAGLRDIIGSTVDTCISSATAIVDLVHVVAKGGVNHRTMLGAWWFTLYYAFDAALVLFTIELLLRRTSCITLPISLTADSLKMTFIKCIEALQSLDEGNTTAERCWQCLQQLTQVMEQLESSPVVPNAGVHGERQVYAPTADHTGSPSLLGTFDGFLDQNLSLFNFNLVGNDGSFLNGFSQG